MLCQHPVSQTPEDVYKLQREMMTIHEIVSRRLALVRFRRELDATRGGQQDSNDAAIAPLPKGRPIRTHQASGEKLPHTIPKLHPLVGPRPNI